MGTENEDQSKPCGDDGKWARKRSRLSELGNRRPVWVYIVIVLVVLIVLAGLAVGIYFGVKHARSGGDDEREIDKEVVIIGAGIAGIRAAQILAEAGVRKIIIVEAEPQIGGRIKSVGFGGRTVELGAAWIQGTDNNPVYQLAQHIGLQGRVSDADNYMVVDSQGLDLTDRADAIYEESFTEASDNVDQLTTGLQGDPQGDQSIREALLDQGWRPTSAIHDVLEVDRYDWDHGVHPSEPSVKFSKPDQITLEDGDEYMVTDERGFRYLVEEMLAVVDDDSNGEGANDEEEDNDEQIELHLGETVVEVEYSPDEVLVRTREHTYRGDYCISTLPLGVLKAREVQFNPALPEWKEAAIDKMGVGAFVVIFIKFADNVQRFWPDVEFLNHASQNRGYYSMITNYEVEGVFPEGSNIIKFDIMGEEAVRVSRLSKAEVRAEINQLLRSMFGQNVALPEDIVISDWLNNPHYLGGHAYWPIGFTPEDHEDLSAHVETLYFAGEAYSRSHGYVHGAYTSGEETAQDVLLCLTGNGACDGVVSGIDN